MSNKLKYLKLSILNCVEPTNKKTYKGYCRSEQQVSEFFLANALTRVMYTENYVSEKNTTSPLATSVSSDFVMANDLAYNSVLDLFL